MARMPRGRVGDVALQVLKEENFPHVAYGELTILDEIAGRIGIMQSISHPLNRHMYILNALDRDKRFEKGKFRVFLGNREGLARFFKPKPEYLA